MPEFTPSDQLIDSLHDLRLQSEYFRAELYWNVQRLSKTRRSSTALHEFWRRRKSLRVLRSPTGGESISYLLPPHAA